MLLGSLLFLSTILCWNHTSSPLCLPLSGFGGSELKSSCLCLLCPLSCLSSTTWSELCAQTEATERSGLSKWYPYFREALDMGWFSNCVAHNCCGLGSHGLQLEPLSCLWVSVWAFASFLAPSWLCHIVAVTAAAGVPQTALRIPFYVFKPPPLSLLFP